MTVEYEEAMRTLSSMFGSVDKEVIDAVLSFLNMERTVEALLAMSATSESTPNGDSLPIIPPEEDLDSKQLKQDEQLARELQNELFLSEARENERHTEVATEEDDSLKEVKEKFNQIGEAAKHKFREFSTMFFKDSKKDAVDIDPATTTNQSTSPPKKAHSPTTTHHFTIPADYTEKEDEEEIIAFDARNVRRRQQVTSDDEDSPHLIDKRLQRSRLQAVGHDDVGAKGLL